MSALNKLLTYFICSVAFAVLIAPLIIKIMGKLKAKQTVLGYVKQHAAKSGTPTMGGFIFIIPVAVVTPVSYTHLTLPTN